jgi:hypothetical protein
MERARANLRKLEQEYNRSVQLFERGLVSSGAFEDLKYELEALRAIYRLAQLEYSYTRDPRPDLRRGLPAPHPPGQHDQRSMSPPSRSPSSTR